MLVHITHTAHSRRLTKSTGTVFIWVWPWRVWILVSGCSNYSYLTVSYNWEATHVGIILVPSLRLRLILFVFCPCSLKLRWNAASCWITWRVGVSSFPEFLIILRKLHCSFFGSQIKHKPSWYPKPGVSAIFAMKPQDSSCPFGYAADLIFQSQFLYVDLAFTY